MPNLDPHHHPHGSDKLYTGSTDGTVRTWDCYTGKCVNVTNLGSEVTSLISEGPWTFVGLPNTVMAYNIQTTSQYTFDGPNGQVVAMIVGNDTLLAGAEHVVISAWTLTASFVERGRLFAKQEIGLVDVAPGGLFFSGDNWIADSLEMVGTWESTRM